MIALSHIDTPVGKMLMGATDAGICLFDFEYRKRIGPIMERVQQHVGEKFADGYHPLFDVLTTQVNEYFTGERKDFTVPLHLAGSPFQVSVWQALLQIPYGETRTYKQQSIFLGNEKAIRAVAGANGENGIAILVPCHRVVGTNGSLTGYGGGLQRKQWLLTHENKHSGKNMQANLFD